MFKLKNDKYLYLHHSKIFFSLSIFLITKSMVYFIPMSTKPTVKIEDIEKGNGQEAKEGDTVIVHYTGWLEDGGKKFDSSKDRGQPFETKIGVGYVIKGWDMGIPGMKVGGKRKLTIPNELGYGKYGAGDDIPGFATLIFEIELLKIK